MELSQDIVGEIKRSRAKAVTRHPLVGGSAHQRSRERVKDMGEVFTPNQYVQQMLALFDERLWSDESIVFFEPACGHGNIAVAIVERRIDALARKYVKAGIGQPIFHAVATAIHTLWAVDICPLNIHLTRKRIADMAVRVLQETEFKIQQPDKKQYIIHLLCALVWQVHENETLSALSDVKNAQTKASQTKVGQRWITENTHKPIRFDFGWCDFYRQSRTCKTVALIYERAARFIDSVLEEDNKESFEDFSFARDAMRVLIEPHTKRQIPAEVA